MDDKSQQGQIDRIQDQLLQVNRELGSLTSTASSVNRRLDSLEADIKERLSSIEASVKSIVESQQQLLISDVKKTSHVAGGWKVISVAGTVVLALSGLIAWAIDKFGGAS